MFVTCIIKVATRHLNKPMNKVKLEDRFEKAVNAFFEAEPDRSDFALSCWNRETALMANTTTFSEKAGNWTSLMRELFMFGPGAFVLFYTTLMAIYFYPTLGLTFDGLFLLFSGAFLTYAGSGNLKNTRNLLVPGSIAVLAVAVSFISSFFPSTMQTDLYFWYSIYMFPISLIVAKLAQAFVSEKK